MRKEPAVPFNSSSAVISYIETGLIEMQLFKNMLLGGVSWKNS